ncbi:MAG TPA: dimethylamine monooxygenase subunit DmmA family protein [Steroidobacteraceae bacterium]|jgi:NAD(P)H-flavin reductase|nr:dimethylamine monooxygenase subunit DmmA family protein [Steroidobacteraceae bacterium]
MLITGIRSKPVYAPLQPDLQGRYHLMVGHGVGAAPLSRLLGDLAQAQPAALQRTRIWFVADAVASAASTEAFQAVSIAELRTFNAIDALLSDLTAAMDQALMGSRLYVAGPESFMGLVMRIADRFNLAKDEVRAEECGTLARRVHCIHCRATIDNVRTNIVQCRCDRWLVVRDHYSRRLAAYMGVMVDAECPGDRPEIKEVFL